MNSLPDAHGCAEFIGKDIFHHTLAAFGRRLVPASQGLLHHLSTHTRKYDSKRHLPTTPQEGWTWCTVHVAILVIVHDKTNSMLGYSRISGREVPRWRLGMFFWNSRSHDVKFPVGREAPERLQPWSAFCCWSWWWRGFCHGSLWLSLQQAEAQEHPSPLVVMKGNRKHSMVKLSNPTALGIVIADLRISLSFLHFIAHLLLSVNVQLTSVGYI